MGSKIKKKIVNIHIPKTAGTSFRALLQPRLRKGFVSVHTQSATKDYYGELRRIARERYPEMGENELSFMSGHYRFRDIWEVLEEHSNDISFVTFIREPVSRMLSDYYYCTTDAHPPHKAFVERYPTFEHYMQDVGQLSKQLKYLSLSQSLDADAIYDSTMRNFDFVGLTENFESHSEVFMREIGFAGLEKPRKNVNKKSGQVRSDYDIHRDQLSALLKDEINLYNRLAANWDDFE